MDSGLLHGASNMKAIRERFEVLTMNLANANTPGFKKLTGVERSFEAELGRKTMRSSRYPKVEVGRDFSQGILVDVGTPLEMALRGEGFFVAEDGNGDPKLTRHGRYQINDQGELVLHDGSKLMGDFAPIRVPPGTAKLEIDKDGEVLADGAAVGALRIVNAQDPQRLRPEPGGFFRPEENDPLDASGAEVLQGMRETSNVSVVDEMLELIVASKLYQASSRAMNKRDQTMSRLISQVT